MSDTATNGAASRTIDLDAARAARAEKLGPAPTVVVGGESFDLPRELPADVVTAYGLAARGDVTGIFDALEQLFGATAWAKIKVGLSWDDAAFLLEESTKLYGFTLPG